MRAKTSLLQNGVCRLLGRVGLERVEMQRRGRMCSSVLVVEFFFARGYLSVPCGHAAGGRYAWLPRMLHVHGGVL